MNEVLVLSTEQECITLRLLSTTADDAAYFEAVNANREHLSQFDDSTAKKYRSLEDVRNARLNAGDKVRMGIWYGDTFVGTVNATPDEEGAEIGYWLDSRHTGHGYATLAVKALGAYVAEHYPKVHAEVVEGNDASARVLERAGFKRTAEKAGRLIFELSQIKNPEQNNTVKIRNARMSDLEPLRPILEHWIRDRNTGSLLQEEVKGVTAAIEASIQGKNGRTYVIAEDSNDKVVGVMGMANPDEDMQPYITTAKPVELMNAYVDPVVRGSGVGKKLAAELEVKARLAGYKELIINSGPRYRDTGWFFWSSLYGEPVAVQEDLYGLGGDAPVWRKSL
jgi:RimJ/RimL family protein N-acetyltransferase